MASEGDGAITMPRAELNLKDELIAANLTRYEYFIVNGVRGTELLSAMPIIDASKYIIQLSNQLLEDNLPL